MWGDVRNYVIAAVVIIAAWLGGVLALNATLFSPSGVVLGYLESLERGDVGEALARLGLGEVPPVLPNPASTVSAFGVTNTVIVGDDTTVVSVEYLVDGIPAESLFEVTRLPRVLGVFDRWAFADIPTALVTVTVDGGSEVTINGVTLDESATSSGIALLYPGRYEVSWSSGWLATETVDLIIDDDQPHTLRLTATPTDQLRDRVNRGVADYLDTCTSQAVLQPAGCPFGVSITDRVVGDVIWEVTTDPDIQLTIADDDETVIVSALGGEATLTVSLRSLFDGSISDYTETQPIDVTGVIVGLSDNAPQFIVD